MFLLPVDLLDLQEYWKQLRCFELHPGVSSILRAEGGAYGVDRWTNVVPHLKTFCRGLPPPTTHTGTSPHGEPLAWLWLTSSNLSAGALGFNEVMRNFEAGILFHSGPETVYCTWPPSNPLVLPQGWPLTARTVHLPLPYRFDAPHYTPQDDPWDPTPDILFPPYLHSYHDLPHYARLRGLMPQIEAIFTKVRDDLKELATRYGLDAQGRPLRALS